MNARVLMSQRATLVTNTATGRNSLNQPAKPVWPESTTVIPLSARPQSIRKVNDQNKLVVIDVLMARIPASLDLSELNHRLANIRDRQGNVKYAGQYTIEGVMPYGTYKHVTLRRVD